MSRSSLASLASLASLTSLTSLTPRASLTSPPSLTGARNLVVGASASLTGPAGLCAPATGPAGPRDTAAEAPTRAGSGSPYAARLRSSGRVVSPSPILCCRRFIHFGAHQQSSPSIFMIAGTRNIRTMVASSNRAISRPKARYFIITRSENTNAPATTARTRAAAVISRPVVAVPMRIASVVDMPRSRASTIRDTRKTS